MVVLKGKSRATQRCPREVLRRDDREGTTSVPVCLSLVVGRESYQTTKVELLQEHMRDKVRRRFTLLVTAETWWDDREGIDVLVVVAAVVVRGSVKSRQR